MLLLLLLLLLLQLLLLLLLLLLQQLLLLFHLLLLQLLLLESWQGYTHGIPPKGSPIDRVDRALTDPRSIEAFESIEP